MGIAPDASFTMMSGHILLSQEDCSLPQTVVIFWISTFFIPPSGNGLNFGEADSPYLLDRLYIVNALAGPSNCNIGEFPQKDNVVWSFSRGPGLVNGRNIRE